MQRRVDGNHITDLDEGLDIRMERQSELLFDGLGQPVLVGIVQLDIERLQPPQHRETDATRGDGAFSSPMITASVLMASGDCWRASSCTSPNTFGRPLGLPLTPF